MIKNNLTPEQRAALLRNYRNPPERTPTGALDEFLESLFAWAVILAVVGGIGWFAVVKVQEWTAPPKCYLLNYEVKC